MKAQQTLLKSDQLPVCSVLSDSGADEIDWIYVSVPLNFDV